MRTLSRGSRRRSCLLHLCTSSSSRPSFAAQVFGRVCTTSINRFTLVTAVLPQFAASDYFLTIAIDNPEGFKKISYAVQKKAGMAISPPPGQRCDVTEEH